MFCIDASVIISAKREIEPESARSKNFLDNIERGRHNVFFPEIIITEVAFGLFRATKDVDFTKTFITAMRKVPNFIFMPVDSRLTGTATEIICETGLRSADAMYVALAHEYHLTLVTLDREQLKKGGTIVPARLP